MSTEQNKKVRVMMKAVEEASGSDDLVVAIEKEAERQGVVIAFEDIEAFLA